VKYVWAGFQLLDCFSLSPGSSISRLYHAGFLIYIRDPQFYALPVATRANNGNIRVMGFPPIGIMSLSAVIKQSAHECHV
jgi:hypothetical protein